MRRLVGRALALSLVVTLALLAAGCRKQVTVGTEGRVEPSGNVLLTGSGGDPVSLRVARTLRPGDVIEVSDGTALVTLPNGATLELRPRAIVAFDRGPELRTGDLLVVARSVSQAVRSAGTDVTVNGVGRVTQTLALRVGSYVGSATVQSGGSSIDVPTLRQVALPAVGVVPGAPSPLLLQADDQWDRRFLGDVLDEIVPLERLANGFGTQTAPDQGVSVGFYRSLVPALAAESGFQQSFVDQVHDPGEVLLATSIAVLGRKGTFDDRLASAAAFRQAGAPWALVAKDQDVPSFEALRRSIENTIRMALPEPPEAVAVAVVTTTPARPTTTSTRPARPAPTEPPPAAPGPPPTTAPGEPPVVATPPDEPAPGILDPLVDPVVSLLDGLLGGGSG